MRSTSRRRGSSLLLAIVIIGILAVIAVALLKRTQTEMESISAKRHYDVAVSCADGARQMLMSQFRTFGVSPTSIVLDQTVGDKRYTSGHYDNFGIASVVPGAGTQAGAIGVTDIANRTSKAKLGGQVYRMTVVCTDTATVNGKSSRQSEVEFLVRFGL